MTTIDELKTELEQLSPEQFAELGRWLSEKDWGVGARKSRPTP